MLIHLIDIPITNLSVNPASSTGPALFVGGWALGQLWLFWIAPMIGAALQEWSIPSSPAARNDRIGILYGSFGASWAQRNPTFGSCSVGSPFVRKEDRSRYGLLIYDPPRCTFAVPSTGPRGLIVGFFV